MFSSDEEARDYYRDVDRAEKNHSLVMHHYNFTSGQLDDAEMFAVNRSIAQNNRRRTAGRELLLHDCYLHFTDCCLQICIPSPLAIQFNARLQINDGQMKITTSLHILLAIGVWLPGNWPEINLRFSATLTLNYGSGVSLCDIVPAFGNFLRTTGLGCGEDCGTFLGITMCLPLPCYTLADFLGCDRLLIG